MKEAFKKNPYDPGVGRHRRDDDSVRKGTNKQIHNRGLREDGPNQRSLGQSELIFQPIQSLSRLQPRTRKARKDEDPKNRERQREKEKKKSEALCSVRKES
jgi:hypothetical protein